MWENEKEPETKNREVLRTQLCPPKGDTLLAPPRAHGPHDTRSPRVPHSAPSVVGFLFLLSLTPQWFPHLTNPIHTVPLRNAFPL